MMDRHTVESIHHILIDQFGGSRGVRDVSGLEAALARPYASFDGVDLYPALEEKAVALFESIIMNHPFVDGNKRTAYVLMRLLLLNAGLDISASRNEKYSMVISVSKGEMGFEEIKAWLKARFKQVKTP